MKETSLEIKVQNESQIFHLVTIVGCIYKHMISKQIPVMSIRTAPNQLTGLQQSLNRRTQATGANSDLRDGNSSAWSDDKENKTVNKEILIKSIEN